MAYFFGGNIMYDFTLSNFENKEKIFKYTYLKKKIFYLKISTTENVTPKIGNTPRKKFL